MVWKGEFQLMQILGLLCMYFDAALLFVTSHSLLFRLALAILWVWDISANVKNCFGFVKTQSFTNSNAYVILCKMSASPLWCTDHWEKRHLIYIRTCCHVSMSVCSHGRRDKHTGGIPKATIIKGQPIEKKKMNGGSGGQKNRPFLSRPLLNQ